ncbi:hypothetical protein B0H14DRAFT_3426401 [Mycena olivaceomarginata]|nr:hypothetical protein B0H14DRAFT_3426401 [Mycena olivaceomarginata]
MRPSAGGLAPTPRHYATATCYMLLAPAPRTCAVPATGADAAPLHATRTCAVPLPTTATHDRYTPLAPRREPAPRWRLAPTPCRYMLHATATRYSLHATATRYTLPLHVLAPHRYTLLVLAPRIRAALLPATATHLYVHY